MFLSSRRFFLLICALIGAMNGVARAAPSANISPPTSRDELYRAAVSLWQQTEPPSKTYDLSGQTLSSRRQLASPAPDSKSAAQYRRVGELASAFLETAQRDGVRDGRANQLLFIGGLTAYSGGDFERARVLLEKLLADGSYRRFYLPTIPARGPSPSRSPAAGLKKLLLQLSLQAAPDKTPAPLASLKAITETARGVTAAEREHQRWLDALPNANDRDLLTSLDFREPQPDAQRANALPPTETMLAAAWDKYLPAAVAKVGGKAVRDYLREEARPGAAFSRIAADRLASLDKTIIAQYQAEYRKYLAAHNYDAARGRLKLILAEYENSDAARLAQTELAKIAPQAVRFYTEQAQASFQPTTQFGQPQTQAREYYAKLLHEMALLPEGEKSGEAGARLGYARALGTEGKLDEALNNLQTALKENPDDEEEAAAQFQTGFLLGSLRLKKYEQAVSWMQKVWTEHPRSRYAPEALWHAAFFELWRGQPAAGLPLLQKLSAEYSASPRARHAPKWIEKFQQAIKETPPPTTP